MNIHTDTRPISMINEENLTSDKFFIQYPIKKICNLLCEYCFHTDFFQKKSDNVKYENSLGFTIPDFLTWLITNIIPRASKIVIHFSGGEPFLPENIKLWSPVVNYLDEYPYISFDFLTNGTLCQEHYITILDNYKNNIHRIGFTWHRKILDPNSYITAPSGEKYTGFLNTVKSVKDLGINVYIKEIFFKEYTLGILKHKRLCEEEGIQFNLQDFQALDASPQDYNIRDLAFISSEYKHQGNYCSCWQGYRSISIRGYDISAGDVIACWLDPKIIGNIQKNMLDLNFRVEINKSLCRRNVIGGNYNYSKNGTWDRDRKSCEH